MPTSMPCFETRVPETYEEAGFTPAEFGNLLDADADADALRSAGGVHGQAEAGGFPPFFGSTTP